MGQPSFNFDTPEARLALEQLKGLQSLRSKLKSVGGINQTMAMECENISPGFVNYNNPIMGFSVLPSKANFNLAMEELDKVQIGIIAGVLAATAALIYKFVKWIRGKKDDGGGEGGGGGGGGSDLPSPEALKETGSTINELIPEFDKQLKELIHRSSGDPTRRSELKTRIDEKVYGIIARGEDLVTTAVVQMAKNEKPVADIQDILVRKMSKNVERITQMVERVTDLAEKVKGISESEEANVSAEAHKLEDEIRDHPYLWDETAGPGKYETAISGLSATATVVASEKARIQGGLTSEIRNLVSNNLFKNYDEINTAWDQVSIALEDAAKKIGESEKAVRNAGNVPKDIFDAFTFISKAVHTNVIEVLKVVEAAKKYTAQVAKFLDGIAGYYAQAAGECRSIASSLGDKDAADEFVKIREGLQAVSRKAAKANSIGKRGWFGH